VSNVRVKIGGMKYGYARTSTDDQTTARDVITMLDDLRARGVKFHSLTEAIDTNTLAGRAMWQMIGVLAEIARSLISERTRARVKAAQKRGVKFGRKLKLTPQQIDHARKLIHGGEDRQKVAALFKVGRKTLFRALAIRNT
jgi:DNA invertase Pin-like site-specific DNA recombinase